jgi:RNA polymerase sigma factor (sigma-70 family)
MNSLIATKPPSISYFILDIYGNLDRFLVKYYILILIHKRRNMFTQSEHCEKVLCAWLPIREKLYWVIVNITNDKGLAEDVLQEALITAIEKYQTLKDESKFEPWFLTISIRKAYEILSARKLLVNAQSIEDDITYSDDGFAFTDAINSVQYKDMVLFIFAKLKPETKRYLFYLRYIEDKSMEDIMEITGMKEGTLKSIFHRMRKELSFLLVKEYDLHV